MVKITDKEKKRVEELVDKALNGGLKKNEIDELYTLLKKAKNEQENGENKKKNPKEWLSEGVMISLAEKALVVAKRKYHNCLPLRERHKIAIEKAKEMKDFYVKQTPKLKAEAERLKKEREEREFYENYYKKYDYEL